jgi:hypothetical protein
MPLFSYKAVTLEKQTRPAKIQSRWITSIKHSLNRIKVQGTNPQAITQFNSPINWRFCTEDLIRDP